MAFDDGQLRKEKVFRLEAVKSRGIIKQYILDSPRIIR